MKHAVVVLSILLLAIGGDAAAQTSATSARPTLADRSHHDGIRGVLDDVLGDDDAAGDRQRVRPRSLILAPLWPGRAGDPLGRRAQLRLGRSGDTLYALKSDHGEGWDSVVSAWVNVSTQSFSYDPERNLFEVIQTLWGGSGWENAWKKSYAYDTAGRCIERLFWEWSSGDWTPDDRSTYLYDTSGYPRETVHQSLEGGSWSNEWRYLYTVGANGTLVEANAFIWDDSAWVLDLRDAYAYDVDGALAEIVFQWRNGSSWDNIGRSSYAYDAGGILLEQIYQNWRDGAWENGARFTYAYDLGGNQVEGGYQMWEGGAWRDFSRTELYYGLDGNRSGYLYQRWSGTAWLDDERHSLEWQAFPTDVNDQAAVIDQFSVSANYPNPFNPSTTISFRLPAQRHVSARVIDLLGREVATLLDGVMPMGEHTVTWNAGSVPSGVYYCRVTAERSVATKKLLLMR